MPKFEKFFGQPDPGFWCSAAGDDSKANFLARVRHETNPPASPEALAEVAGLPEQVSESLKDFYKRRNGFTLYRDTLSEAAGIRLFRIEEWGEAAALMLEAYEHLGEDEDPDHVVDGLVMGEVPQSGNYFVMPTRGAQIGEVFYVNHDGWYEAPFAQDFNGFLLRVIEEPARLLSEELGCYTRYSDGKTETQWIPERYVPDASRAGP